MKIKRQTISKRVRFEVFKRDSFKCQYCGAAAPEVLLELDHIHPVAKGGEQTDITNLITACNGCNAGKSDKLLSDSTAASKRKAQLDHLQERREQLQMMSEWQLGLVDLIGASVAACAELWHKITVTYSLNEKGLASLRSLIVKFSAGEVMTAITKSERYLVSGTAGYTQESVEHAWSKVGGICVLERRAKEDPELHEIYKIRYMLINRAPSLQPWHITNRLDSLRKVGFTAPEIRRSMEKVFKWHQFDDAVDAMLAEVEG